MFNVQCSTQAFPGLHHAGVLPGHRQMAAVVEILDVVNRPELGSRRAMVPRHVSDVHGHGTVGSHSLAFGLLVVVSVFVCTHRERQRQRQRDSEVKALGRGSLAQVSTRIKMSLLLL